MMSFVGNYPSGVAGIALGLFLGLSAIYVLFGLDDIFIDAMSWLFGQKPMPIHKETLSPLARAERPLGIIVPAWKEGHIIQRMLTGNIARIAYRDYYFFVGVYPNDVETIEEVRAVQKDFPNVIPVINTKPGPTSKGQMLNQVITCAFELEKTKGFEFAGFVMQDAEDLIHPAMLALINLKLDDYDFIQTPVFSLGVNRGQLVASTYMDEFAENHTKDILVRQMLRAAIPSAGVGTGLSRRLVLHMTLQQGGLFNEKSLTEDYELGVTVHAEGFKPHFACHYLQEAADGSRDYIATREYFPKLFMRSVRQKTRWTLGICLQGWRNLGWKGGWTNRYFLMRDRKGLWMNICVFFGYLVLAAVLCFPEDRAWISEQRGLGLLLKLNAFFLVNRLFHKTLCVGRVYGWAAALPCVLSWPVSNVINALAGLSALKKDIQSRVTQASIPWVKTEHELPDFFGSLPTKINT